MLLTFSVLLQEFGITSRWQYYFWSLVLLTFLVIPPEECKEQSLDICEQNDCVCEHPPEPASIFTRMPPVTDAIKVLIHLPHPCIRLDVFRIVVSHTPLAFAISHCVQEGIPSSQYKLQTRLVHHTAAAATDRFVADPIL